MPRYALKIEYNGAPYFGWQRQRDLPSVQQSLEVALSKIAPELPEIQGAGRTDKGVHAMGQVAHVNLEKEWTPFRLSEALNFHLKPQPISITAVAITNDEFHARYDALERRYHFRLLSRRAPVVMGAGWVWQVQQPLDIEAMREGAAYLVGHHDFTTFRSSICQAKSPIKTLDELTMVEVPVLAGIEIHFTIRARSFLHNQVRSFVGSLERVGSGAWEPIQIKHALEAVDRTECGPVSPPQGLYLADVIYPNDPFADA